MKLTTDHSASSYGIPVFVDGENQPLDYCDGVKRLIAAIQKTENLTSPAAREWLANKLGVSPRTVEGWEQGRTPDRKALYDMAPLLD